MDPQTLLDNLGVGVVAIGPDWSIVAWNPCAVSLLGIPADRVLGRNFWVAFPGTRGTHVERALHEILLDGEPRAFLTPPLGPAEPAEGARVLEVRVTRGPGNHLLLAFRHPPADADALLAASAQDRVLYTQLFNLLPLPAVLVTPEGRILEANPAGTELLGVAAADVRGRPLQDWAPASHAPLGAAVRAAVTSPQRFQLTLGGDDARREVEVRIQNVAAPGESPKLLVLALDVSREVQLQRKLLQSDRLSQLGALVSGVAHELNNPLAAIAAFAEVLKVDADTPDLKESADVIHGEAMRAGRVVQTLLDFARQRPRAIQAVDVKDIAERAVGLHRTALRKARVQPTIMIDSSVPAVMGDPQELQQILLSTISNAEQAIAASGQPGKVFVTARRVGDRVAVLVEDTGPGIPPAILERVFEPFFTTRGESATGLGLTISYGLAKANGGRMYIHNIEGGGVQVGIELPVEHSGAQVPSGRVDRVQRPLSVLVVDDEESVRRGLTRMAERLGHRVTSAADYAEAARQLAPGAAGFDAMLVDVHLDEANSGFDLFESLRREGHGREQRVIFTTGDSMSTKTRDLLDESAQPLLKKPFNLEELREVLDRVGAAGSEKRGA